MSELSEIAKLFLRLGTTAFGGPAAHIALMREEVVDRRKWVGEQRFLDLLGAANLVPGPTSTELAIHLGHARAGWAGLVVAGLCFIVPACAMVLGLAWAYVRYGTSPAGESLLYGVEPVVIAVVGQAIVKLVPTAVKDAFLALIGVAVLALYLAGGSEIALLFGAGVFVVTVRGAAELHSRAGSVIPVAFAAALTARALEGPDVHLDRLFLVFAKIGAVLYGSGYVLLAFLHSDLVERLGWLSEQQLIDAVAVGQVTPGPLFTTATFVGYLLGGVPGAALATVAIFAPSFLFVAVTNPLITGMRRSRWAGALLDGVNVAALALMAGVVWELARRAVVDVPTALLALGALVLLVTTKMNSVWLILAGAAAGLAAGALRWVPS